MNAVNTDLAVARVAIVKVAESLRAHLATTGAARLTEDALAVEVDIATDMLSPLQQVMYLMAAEAAFVSEGWTRVSEDSGEWQAA